MKTSVQNSSSVISHQRRRIQDIFSVKVIREKLASIKAAPTKVATGYALGIFLGTTPFIGMKVVMALIFTSLFRWNKTASVIGVYHINGLTAPFFYSLSFLIGKAVLGEEINFTLPETFTVEWLLSVFYGNASIFFSLLIGGVILGIPMAAGAYYFSMAVIKPSSSHHGHTASRLALTKLTSSPLPRRFAARNDISHQLPSFTLITGASTGLGRAFAIECARQHRDLILVALPGRNLSHFCKTLEEEYGIRAVAFETDLTDRRCIMELSDNILRNYRVDFLINNAGTGGTVAFDESRVNDIERIISLNIVAVSLLTRLMIPELKSHPKAYILNVSSMAAFSPIPFKTVYPASKAFVTNFSRSLNQELKGSGVNVGVIHPGPILTNSDVTVRIVRQGSAGKIGLLQACDIAKSGINGVLSGKKVMIPGFMNKFNRFLILVIPSGFRLNFLSQVIHREIVTVERNAA